MRVFYLFAFLSFCLIPSARAEEPPLSPSVETDRSEPAAPAEPELEPDSEAAPSKSPTAEPMTGARLLEVVSGLVEDVEAAGSAFRFDLEGTPILCVFDESHNRMRFVAPIQEFSQVTAEQKDAMFVANFHSALDARYGVSDGILYAAFIHPLSTLTETEVLSGLYQVVSLQQSFGREYSSGLMTFGGRSVPRDDKKNDPNGTGDGESNHADQAGPF